jgi:hypothetical protein
MKFPAGSKVRRVPVLWPVVMSDAVSSRLARLAYFPNAPSARSDETCSFE